MTPMSAAQPWYRDGLRFACTQCGNCCTGAPGHVWVSEAEIAALAARVGLEVADFRRRYTRRVPRRGVSLIEKANHDCVFFQRGQGCTVYAERPKQCRTWPFWGGVVRDEESWRHAGEGCPGIGRGAVHDAASIAASVADDGLP
jgi:uncharacterized protein